MASRAGGHRKVVGELESGDETTTYGVVEHREGRKVWFVTTIVTFPTLEDEVEVLSADEVGDGGPAIRRVGDPAETEAADRRSAGRD